MSTTTYRRVSSAEPNDDEDNFSNNTFRSIQRRSSPSDRLTDKAIALAWVLVAAAVAKYTKFFHILFVDDNGTAETAGDSSKSLRTPNRTLLQVCALCFVTNTVLLLYLTVYLPRFKGLTDSSAWEVYCPRVVPTMTIVGILFGLIMIRATWPVWGFLSPLILGIELMGFLFALHFLPWPFG